MKHFLISLLVIAFISPGAVEPVFWDIYNQGGGTTHRMQKATRDSFSLELIRTDPAKNASAVVIANIRKSLPSQHFLLFRARTVNGGIYALTPLITFDKTFRFGPRLQISSRQWQDFRLPLDSTFRLQDGLFFLKQLKFAVNISDQPSGKKVVAEIGNIRIVSPGEAGFSVGMGPCIVKLAPPPAKKHRKGARKVFFHLDNDDDSERHYSNRRPEMTDRPAASRGFREMLLEGTDGCAVLTNTPESADVIVYSSCSPNPEMSKRIRRAVEKGIPLFVASEVADPELEEILPVKQTLLPVNGLPEREKVVWADSEHPVARRRGLSAARFGIYRDVAVRNGKSILSFENGTPAVIEGRFGQGKLIYSSFSLGADIIPGTTSHDAFLIRCLGYLSGRELPENARKTQEKDAEGYYPGAHLENFGRFGHLPGDGLLTEQITDHLSVVNGSAEYSFSLNTSPVIRLERWRMRDQAGGVGRMVSWNLQWDRIGLTTLETRMTIPGEWRGRDVFFRVEKGIDDTADVYCNGQKIGGVTEKTPNYWRVEHRYRIPADLLSFGKENLFQVRIHNLRGSGGFNSCPEVLIPAIQPVKKVTIDRINWIGKGGNVSWDGKTVFRFDTSLAFPGIRWDIRTTRILLSLNNIADYAGFRERSGRIKVVDLRKTETLPVDWKTPWLLLFGRENPLLLVFSHPLKKLSVVRNDDNVNGLELAGEERNPIGVVVPIWIRGRRIQDTAEWGKSFPDSLTGRCDQWTALAFHYPAFVRDRFSVDRKRNKVDIVSDWEYLSCDNDWNFPARYCAPVPSLAWLCRGVLFESGEVREFDLPTTFGPFAAKPDARRVRWSLRLPRENPVPQIHNKGFPAWEVWENRLFSSAIRWSCGGGVRMEDWSPEHPFGKQFPRMKNISAYAWLMGLNQNLDTPSALTEENRRKFWNRLQIRFYAPVERFQYKSAIRWREEPFSRIRYPLYFNSYYPHKTTYEGQGGSQVDFGDQNEASMMILAIARKLADFHGERDFVLANWNYLRHAARIHLVSDDWGHLSCHCRESGGPANIDMLNCEYPAMMALARCAEIAGDSAMRDQALYRAARRAVASIGRYKVVPYLVKQNLAVHPETIDVATGFTEEGAVLHRESEVLGAHFLFDMSQGQESDLFSLTKACAGKEIQIVLNHQLNLIRKGLYLPDHAQLEILARLSSDVTDAELIRWVDALRQNRQFNQFRSGDWPGMVVAPAMEAVRQRLAGKIEFALVEDCRIRKAVFDPETGILKLEFDAGEKAEMRLKSSKRVEGKGIEQHPDGTIDVLISKPGEYHLSLRIP